MREARSTGVVVVLAAATLFASGAMAASGLPRLFAKMYCSGSSCTGVYELQPRAITALSVADGGNLTKLSWSSWTAKSATATGTAIDSNMGTTTKSAVDVSASRPRNGLFTRLTIVFMLTSGPTQTEKLKFVNGDPPEWMRISG